MTSNDIHFPWEWMMSGDFGHGFTQITLVDDKIAIHKPTAVGAEHTKSRKVSDDSYIRAIGLFNVKVPKPFLEALNVRIGDKIDLTREENRITVRKHPDEPIAPEPEPPEPQLAFCCVCGCFHRTGQCVVKVRSKYICRECIEAVKAL